MASTSNQGLGTSNDPTASIPLNCRYEESCGCSKTKGNGIVQPFREPGTGMVDGKLQNMDNVYLCISHTGDLHLILDDEENGKFNEYTNTSVRSGARILWDEVDLMFAENKKQGEATKQEGGAKKQQDAA